MPKISNSIYFILLNVFLIFNVSIAPLCADSSVSPERDQAQMQIPSAMINEYLESCLKPTLKLYEQLDFICEHLAQVINNQQLRNIDKKEVVAHIKYLRSTIQEIKKGSYVVVDPYSIKALLSIVEALIEHMRIVVANGMKQLPELHLEQVIKRSLEEDNVNFEQLEQQLKNNEKIIKQLDNEAQNVGLSFFNRSYRRVEKFSSDHHLVSRSAKALLLGVGLYIVLSRLDDQTIRDMTGIQDPIKNPSIVPQGYYSKFVNNFINFKQNYFGQKLYYNEMNHQLGNSPQEIETAYKNATWLGKLEGFLGKHRLGIIDLTIPPLITCATLAKPFANNWQQFTIWSQKKWESIRSRLRGGPVDKKVESWKKEPKVRFKDIIGKNHHKNVLGRVVDYIRDHERYDRAGIAPEAGYLLAGPSRTGKTYLAEAVAGEVKDVLLEKGITDVNFFAFNAADVIEWDIEIIMQLAYQSAPCVLFIDEIDMCGWQRERDAKALSKVLTAMSGCMNKDRSKTVIVIGATNKPQNLDQALLQKGRFGKILWFDYPTFEDRFTYLMRELENRSIMSIDESYIKKLAQETDRCSFDDLNAILVTALQKSKTEGRALQEEHLEQAFDEEIRHVMLDDLPLPDDQKNILATHQAGHTLATMLLDGSEFLTKVTIRPISKKIQEECVWAKYSFDGKSKKEQQPQEQIEYGKIFSSKPNHNDTIKTQAELLNMIKVELAGHEAETILLGASGHTYHKNDKSKALQMAKYVVFEGMNENELPKGTRDELSKKAYALLIACQKEVNELLEQYKNKLVLIAKTLQEKLTLSHAELVELLKDNVIESDSVQESAVAST